MSERTVKVSELIRYLNQKISSDSRLSGVSVEGEVSEITRSSRGHWYFTLKDSAASISCAMFAFSNRRASFFPKKGDVIIATGDINVYEERGSLQLKVYQIRQGGEGALLLKLKQLQEKLTKEGLFAEEHKKPFVKYPFSVGLVTGADTQAMRDVYRTMSDRWPVAKITLYPSQMQGREAPLQIITALSQADIAGHDAIILARGGGAEDDLLCFNDEALVRFIYAMHTPVAVGVGHEGNIPMVDLVADGRANTPTGAVSLITPDIAETVNLLKTNGRRLLNAAVRRSDYCRGELSLLADTPVFRDPGLITQAGKNTLERMKNSMMEVPGRAAEIRMRLSGLQTLFTTQMRNNTSDLRSSLKKAEISLKLDMSSTMQKRAEIIAQQKISLNRSAETAKKSRNEQQLQMIRLLDAYSPLKVMERGYAVAYKDDEVLRSVSQIAAGDHMTVRLSDGRVTAQVEKKEKFNG